MSEQSQKSQSQETLNTQTQTKQTEQTETNTNNTNNIWSENLKQMSTTDLEILARAAYVELALRNISMDIFRSEVRREANEKAEELRVAAERKATEESLEKSKTKVQSLWEKKEDIAKRAQELFRYPVDCTLKVWMNSNATEKRIYIGTGFNSNFCQYFHTGSSNRKPGELVISRELREKESEIVEFLGNICKQWNKLTVDIPGVK